MTHLPDWARYLLRGIVCLRPERPGGIQVVLNDAQGEVGLRIYYGPDDSLFWQLRLKEAEELQDAIKKAEELQSIFIPHGKGFRSE